MELNKALSIVLELAKQNTIDHQLMTMDDAEGLRDIAKEQDEAIATVEALRSRGKVFGFAMNVEGFQHMKDVDDDEMPVPTDFQIEHGIDRAYEWFDGAQSEIKMKEAFFCWVVELCEEFIVEEREKRRE
jgi:hypothetical protein